MTYAIKRSNGSTSRLLHRGISSERSAIEILEDIRQGYRRSRYGEKVMVKTSTRMVIKTGTGEVLEYQVIS